MIGQKLETIPRNSSLVCCSCLVMNSLCNQRFGCSLWCSSACANNHAQDISRKAIVGRRVGEEKREGGGEAGVVFIISKYLYAQLCTSCVLKVCLLGRYFCTKDHPHSLHASNLTEAVFGCGAWEMVVFFFF